MPDPITNQDIHEELKRLAERVNVIAQPYENALAERLYAAAREKLLSYGKLFLFILIPALGYFGVRTFNDLASVARETVVKKVAESMDVEMHKAVDFRMARFDEELKGITANAERNSRKSDDRFSIFKQQVTTDLSKVNDNVSKVAGTSAPAGYQPLSLPQAAKPAANAPPVSGYAYFGLRKPNGEWTDVGFRIPDSSPDSEPREGQKATVLTPTNARSGAIEYPTSTTYKLAPSIGVLPEGSSLTIERVFPYQRPPAGTQYWIKFKDLPAAAFRATSAAD